MSAPLVRYICSGEVRGDCGVRHWTVQAAAACCYADAWACRQQGGYSDRFPWRVTVVGGVVRCTGPLNDDEQEVFARGKV